MRPHLRHTRGQSGPLLRRHLLIRSALFDWRLFIHGTVLSLDLFTHESILVGFLIMWLRTAKKLASDAKLYRWFPLFSPAQAVLLTETLAASAVWQLLLGGWLLNCGDRGLVGLK